MPDVHLSRNEEESEITRMNSYRKKVDETVIAPMLSFMEDWDDCDYTVADAEACKALLYAYLEALAAMKEPSDAAIMEQVRTLVLALNTLNEKTDYTLIETDAREAICEVIQTSAIDCGLKEYGDDVTEEWRDW